MKEAESEEKDSKTRQSNNALEMAAMIGQGN